MHSMTADVEFLGVLFACDTTLEVKIKSHAWRVTTVTVWPSKLHVTAKSITGP